MSNVQISREKIKGSDDSIPKTQEKVRGYLAIGLLGLFAFALLISFTYILFFDITYEKSDLIRYLFSGLVGMLGVVIGFYYGQNTK